LEAFSLTLLRWLDRPLSMRGKESRKKHWANFAAYWGLCRLQSTSTGELPAELQRESEKGDADTFWFDMSLSLRRSKLLWLHRKGTMRLGHGFRSQEIYVVSFLDAYCSFYLT